VAAAPLSYRDPLYEQLAQTAEAKFGLPSGILGAIRTRGERSNANQVSGAKARTVYQFIPSTRQGFIKEYGIDPWSGPEAATNAAAIHLRDDFRRTGSWDEAIARYHGGQHPRSASRAYARRVGDFDNGDTNMALGQSIFPAPYYGGRDPLAPLAPEPIQQTAPVLADAGPSVPVPAASPSVSRKRGGILGALESVFMPDPGSRWAGALRDGLVNAKESQQNYLEGQTSKQIALETANAKLKQMMRSGEFQVVGNNVFHTRPDGSYEMISPPQNASEHERLIDQWRALPDGDPAKDLIHQLLLGSNSPEVLQNKEDTARIRAGATTKSAQIRASASAAAAAGKTKTPPTGFILDE
jgi:hypothetical protein